MGLHDGAEGLREVLAHARADPDLVELALTHRSFCAEAPGSESNERLEFLGDAVLGLVVTEYLYRAYPDLAEGDLARMRAAVVSTEALAPLAVELGVGRELRLGRGESSSGGREKASILADSLEALIGAVYLSRGLPGARDFVLDRFSAALAVTAPAGVRGDAKNQLQELAALKGLDSPRYRLVTEGPDHDRRFRAEALVGERVVGLGAGRSKKQAERAAAKEAVERLEAEALEAPATPESRSGRSVEGS